MGLLSNLKSLSLIGYLLLDNYKLTDVLFKCLNNLPNNLIKLELTTWAPWKMLIDYKIFDNLPPSLQYIRLDCRYIKTDVMLEHSRENPNEDFIQLNDLKFNVTLPFGCILKVEEYLISNDYYMYINYKKFT